VFVTVFSPLVQSKHQSSASRDFNDLYASEVPLRQVLTGWLPSTRGAQSQMRRFR